MSLFEKILLCVIGVPAALFCLWLLLIWVGGIARD